MISPSRSTRPGEGKGRPSGRTPRRGRGRRDRRRHWDRPPPRLGDGEGPSADEAGEIVDMAVGMVVEQPFAEPEQPLDAEVLAQPGLDLLAAHARIAVRVEQALLGGDGEAGAVDVDRAALQDPVAADRLDAGAFGQAQPDRVVALQLIFAAPAVEAEASRLAGPACPSGRSARCRAARCRRTAPEAPSRTAPARGPPGPKPDRPRPGAPPRPRRRHGPPRRRPRPPPRRLEIVLPQLGVARKADPDPFMRRPFGRLALKCHYSTSLYLCRKGTIECLDISP